MAALIVLVVGVAGCGGTTVPGKPHSSAASTGLPVGWVDQDVSFVAGGVRVYGSYRHPIATGRRPAALLIAGSGPTDRNGNQLGATENSLRLLADQLGTDGVSTLRYDKLFSGRTGAGRYATDPAAADVATFSGEAATALRFLAAQPRTDTHELAVYGHSEGGLYALLLATGRAGPVPQVTKLGLIEPLSRRFLDIVSEQLHATLNAQVRAGQLTAARASAEATQIDQAVAAVRAGRRPGAVPPFAAPLFAPTVVAYVRDIDRYDPAAVAAALPAKLPVLLTCSTNDAQVSCADADHLAAGLRRGHAALDFARLTNMDHALKPDTGHVGAANTAPLPMAPPLAAAIGRFARA